MKTLSLKLLALIITCLSYNGAIAQINFANQNSLLHTDAGVAGSNANNRSGNAVAVVDINFDGFDDIVRLDNNRYVRLELQQAGGNFVYQYIGDFGTGTSCWGMCVGDVDHNGWKDILFNGGSQAKYMLLNNTGTGNLGITNLPNGNIFCQNGNFCDVNNDGWEDIFMCNDVGESRLWINDGTLAGGNYPTEQGNNPYINFNVTPAGGTQNDESGNYGSVFTDIDNDGDVDLYIAHCRQGQPSGDLRRYDVLFENNGSNVFTSTTSTHGSIYSDTQDWTSSFGDIDNDGDFDVLLTGHESGNTNRIFLNNGNGFFSVNTAQPTVSFPANAYESQMIDFDNDGFIDIIMTGSSGAQRIHRNNGNRTFTQMVNGTMGFPAGNILSFGSGDLNHDGRIDLYASYGTGYNGPSGSTDDVLFMNTTSNTNHFLVLNLTGVNTTPSALGARAKIYGAWGVQTREVRAGEAYGNMSSFQLHFGLGSATTVDSVIVDWMSGPTTKIVCPVPADQYLSITQGAPTCTLACTGVTVTPGGPTTLCSGDSVQISAPSGAGYTYLWSDGSTTQNTYANSGGSYSVQVSTGPGCSATSPSVAITFDPVETVSISANGTTTFCPGGSVLLTSTQATGNTWSPNNETTQSISASSSGTYSTSYQGLCQAWPSNSIVVTVLDASAPTTTDDTVIFPAVGTVSATATTTDINWYDAPTGGTLLGSGTNYSPGVIPSDQTFYADATYSYGGSTGNHVGSTSIAASTNNGTTLNGFLKFNVLANCNLVSVQCSTSTAGNRVVELRNNLGAVIISDTINFGTGTQTITLNFPLTPGTNYQLGTNSAFNTASFGFISPQLVRQTTATYPFTLPGIVSITTGNNGSTDITAFYYFFDWVVDVVPTNVCISTRAPATIFVNGPPPVANFSSNDQSVCPGTVVTYMDASTNSPTAWAWTFPGGTPSTSSLQNPTITYNTPGTYNAQLIVNNIDGSDTILLTNYITVNANPTASVTNTGPFCSGTTIQLNSVGGSATDDWTGPGGYVQNNMQNPTIAASTVAMSGVYTVTVTNVAGCSATATTTVVVNALPIPTANNTGPYCVGATIQLNSPTGSTTDDWTGPGGYTSTNTQNPTIAASTVAMSGVYTVTVTNAAGCSATATTTVVVNALPIPTANNTGPYCVGAAIQLNSPTGSASDDWTGPGGYVQNNMQNPTIAASTVAMSGVYTVTVTNAAGCSATATTTVVVNELPTPTADNTGPYCEGVTIQLNSPTGSATDDWTGPGGYTSTNTQNPTIAASTVAMGGVYTVIVTNAAGCSATATTTVTVNPTPTPSATNTGPYCPGATIQLNSVGGSATDDWTGPNSFVQNNVQNPSIASATPAMDGVYTVTVTSGVCSATATTTVIVANISSATADNSGAYCEGETIDLSTIGGAIGYSWTGPNSFSSSSQNPGILSSTVAMDGIYSVTVTFIGGCTSSATTTVIVNANPAAPVITPDGPTIFCSGNSVTLTSSYSIDNVWSTSETTATINVNSSGIYTVTFTDGNGCNSTASQTVTVNPLPTVNLSSFGTVCLTYAPVVLTGGTPAGGTYSGTGVSTGSFDPGTAGVGTHNITYSYTDGNSCSNIAVAQIIVDPCAGIEEQEISFNIYPNPTTDFVNVELTIPVAGEVFISIFDMIGKKVYDTNLGEVNGTVIKTISTQTFANGVYTIKLRVNDHEYSTRVIVK